EDVSLSGLDEHTCNCFCLFVVSGLFEPGFKEFIYVSMSMTWAAASKLCRQNYTDLAMIQDDAENTAVASLVPSTESVWIGLHRVPWKWVKGRRASFINWAPGQPDNINGMEECVWVDKNYQWSDESCGFRGPFFCREEPCMKKCV
uniref:C-type lectin domain-containing protein n=1 Tax=Periophthalmus magnuspinnatus TaxID=409849 RepID=A0A3B4AUE9_9GOBI